MTKPFQLWLPSEGTRSEQRQDPLTEVADYAAGYPQAAAYPRYLQYPASGAFAQEPGRLLRPRYDHRYHNKKKRKCFFGALFDL